MWTTKVAHNQIEGRINAQYYHPKYLKSLKKIENCPWEVKNLEEIAEFSSETRDPRKQPEKEFHYVEISDIDIVTGEIVSSKKILGKNAPSRARMVLRARDIILSTTRPYRGAIAIVTHEFDDNMGSTGFAILKPKVGISDKFLHSVLRTNLTLNQLEQKTTGSNYPAITENELKSVKIPFPRKEVQDMIVETMLNACKQRKNELERTEELIGEIDNVLSEELGIKLSENKKWKTFSTSYSVLEDRLDVDYYDPKNTKIPKLLKNSKFDVLKLKDVRLDIFSGYSPKFEGYTSGREIPVIKTASVVKMGAVGEIDWSNVSFVSETTYNSLPRKQLKINDLLIQSVAHHKDYIADKITIFDNIPESYGGRCLALGKFLIIRPNTAKINPLFLFAYICSSIGKSQLKRHIRGMTAEIYPQDIERVEIPVPSKEVQGRIAERVSRIREEAKKIRQEAEKVIDAANRKVEQMILRGSLNQAN